MKNNLNEFSKNIYSQYGEDGIIEEILRRLESSNTIDKWCVEFGAWDGIYLSNTYNLIKNKSYKGVLIEGNAKKHKILSKNIPQKDVYKICEYVTLTGNSTLDKILEKTPIPIEFDLLSIDIDGCDYYIFESLNKYHPKIICIEFNPTIPNEVEFIQPKDFKIKQGSSPKSLLKLATLKGYSLCAITEANLILVRNNLIKFVIGQDSNSITSLRDDSNIKMFLFSGYDGRLLSNKSSLELKWHRLHIPLSAFQPLPSILRRFSSDYNVIQLLIFKAFIFLKRNKIDK